MYNGLTHRKPSRPQRIRPFLYLYIVSTCGRFLASHDIVITNSVWCMPCEGRPRGSSYIAQTSCNSFAVVWAVQMGGDNKWMINLAPTKTSERISCTGQGGTRSVFSVHV